MWASTAAFSRKRYARAISERTSVPTPEDAYDPAYLRYLRSFDPHEVHKGTSPSTRRGGPAIANSNAAASSPRARTPWPPTISFSRTRNACFPLRNRAGLSSRTPRCARGGTTPTCFEICTLKSSGDSDISKRQEVGRGLRLCVDQNGTRQDAALLGRDGVHAVNLLTVIASEGYDSFAKSLQTETADELRERPRRVEEKLFAGCHVENAGVEYVLTGDDARRIVDAFKMNRLIDFDGQLTEKFREEGLRCVPDGDIPEHLDGFLDQIERIARSAEDTSIKIENGFDTKVSSNKLNDNFHKKEFQDLWARINHKHAYTVEFDSDELRRKAIEGINKNLNVSTPRYRLKQGAQRAEATRGAWRVPRVLAVPQAPCSRSTAPPFPTWRMTW